MFERRPDGTDRITGPDQTKDCPVCLYYARQKWEHDILTIEKRLTHFTSNSDAYTSTKKLLSRSTKVRRICGNCGYMGAWRYANLYSNQNNKEE